MIQEAIDNDDTTMGLSRQAIKQYMAEQYDFVKVSASHFNNTLKKLTEEGILAQSTNGQSWMRAKKTMWSGSDSPNMFNKSGRKVKRG